MLDAPHRVGDPRPEYSSDTALWAILLRLAAMHGDVAVYASLHGVRCCGARLAIQPNGSIRIEPRYTEPVPVPEREQVRDPDSGLLIYATRGDTQWHGDLDWKRETRASLVPHTATIKTLISQLHAILQDRNGQSS